VRKTVYLTKSTVKLHSRLSNRTRLIVVGSFKSRKEGVAESTVVASIISVKSKELVLDIELL